jgi:hypothetical protein
MTYDLRHTTKRTWKTLQQRTRRALDYMSKVHGLPRYGFAVRRTDRRDGAACHYRAYVKCVDVLDAAGEVVHSETVSLFKGFDVKAFTLRLLTVDHGDGAQAIYETNIARHKANHKRGGRKLGSKNKREPVETKRTTAEYKRELRRQELQARPSLRRKRDFIEGGLLHEPDSTNRG